MKILFIFVLSSILFNLVSSSCGKYKDCSEIWEHRVATSSQSYQEDICKNTITECIVRGRYVRPRCFRHTCCIFITMDKYDTNPFLSDKDIARWLYGYFNPHFIIKVDDESECDMNSMYRAFDIITETYNIKSKHVIEEDGTSKRDICVRKIEQMVGSDNQYATIEYPLIKDNDYKLPFKCL